MEINRQLRFVGFSENITMYALMLGMSVLFRNKLKRKKIELGAVKELVVAGVVEEAVVEVSFGVFLVTSEQR